jgi:hypothetical protein
MLLRSIIRRKRTVIMAQEPRFFAPDGAPTVDWRDHLRLVRDLRRRLLMTAIHTLLAVPVLNEQKFKILVLTIATFAALC